MTFPLYVTLVFGEALLVVGGVVALGRSDSNALLAVLAIVGGVALLVATAYLTIAYLRRPVVRE